MSIFSFFSSKNVDDIEKINTRNISVIHIGGFRPTGNPFTSNFGLTALANSDEEWPKSSKDGKNLFFLCQLNLTEVPYVPELLSDIKLMTIFVDRDDWDIFCIRMYNNLDNLVPMAIPKSKTFKNGFEVKYELDIDQPNYDDEDLVLPKNITLSSSKSDIIIDKLKNKHCSKIGGYVSSIQGAPFGLFYLAKPKFCLQIDSEAKIGLGWGDSGTFYVARGTAKGYEDQWFVEVQCY